MEPKSGAGKLKLAAGTWVSHRSWRCLYSRSPEHKEIPEGEDRRSWGSEQAEGIRDPGGQGGVPMGRVTGRFASRHPRATRLPGTACPG